jgi:hypothetical protein
VTQENVFNEIKGLNTRKLASDMPKSIIATVISTSKHKSTYGNSLKLELQTKEGIAFNITYRIPKALTGKGQLVQLLNCLNKLDVPIEEMQGKTFEWQRMELSGTMKGNPRHYPLRLVTK